MKNKPSVISNYQLDSSFHRVHKEKVVESGFGMDNTTDLIEGGFGLYSSAGLKQQLGPIKSKFFRMGFVTNGSVDLDCGLETFHPTSNHVVFTFPGQVFSFYNRSNNLSAYYMLFTEEFIKEVLVLRDLQEQFPFYSYAGVQCFALQEEDAHEIKDFIEKISFEIQNRKNDLKKFIQLYMNLIFLQAKRSYDALFHVQSINLSSEKILLCDYKKLVSKYFSEKKKVSDYADMLHISADHLNKTVKLQSGKTAHQLIEEMILIEAKAQLLHTNLSVAEIAYQLQFSDPSHFNKFFKKTEGITPLQFRNRK